MPIYVYRCEHGHEEEVKRHFDDAMKPLLCLACGTGEMKRVFTPPIVLVRGVSEGDADRAFNGAMGKRFGTETTPDLPTYKDDQGHERVPNLPKTSHDGLMHEWMSEQ